MSLGMYIGRRRQHTAVTQGTTLGPFGITVDKQGERPSALAVQVKREAGTSAHSVTIEGSMDLAGPWEVLQTITDELVYKVSTKLPDYYRIVAGTSTGGNLTITHTGAVN